ncbi:MAG: sirohydrochlorin chelatase [Spirulinaceae cyanobacterium]
MTLSSAYLLIFHGSRDPRPQIAGQRLAYLIQQRLGLVVQDTPPLSLQKQQPNSLALLNKTASPLIATAVLELGETSLHQSITQFALQAQQVGIKQVKILPMFLLAGVHVKEDIPNEIAVAQKNIPEEINLELLPYLGSNNDLKEILAHKFAQFPTSARILLSHGSRRLGGNQPVKAMASSLNAAVAYWSVEPNLQAQVTALEAIGHQKIAILPYFLFNGGITEAIATQFQQLQSNYTHLQLLLGEPLGTTTELADLVAEKLNVC